MQLKLDPNTHFEKASLFTAMCGERMGTPEKGFSWETINDRLENIGQMVSSAQIIGADQNINGLVELLASVSHEIMATFHIAGVNGDAALELIDQYKFSLLCNSEAQAEQTIEYHAKHGFKGRTLHFESICAVVDSSDGQLLPRPGAERPDFSELTGISNNPEKEND